MAQKNKAEFTARIDEELLKKFYAVAQAEGRTPNNHFLHLLRTNVAYYERIHGKIDVSKVEIPETEDEIRLVQDFLSGNKYTDIRPVIDCAALIRLQQEADQVHIHDDLVRYVVDLIQSTRDCELLSLGAGPRATLAVLATARAYAYLQERDYVTPDDIRKLLAPVLCHRFVLSTDARMKKLTAEQILKELVLKIPVPILR